MNVILAFGIASSTILIGMFLRAKIKLLRNMLVPSTVMAGILGFLFMNIALPKLDLKISTNLYSEIVSVLFTMSFISIGLTNSNKSVCKTSSAKNIAKGSMALGLIWCILYSVTPVVGALVVYLTGKSVELDPMYGMLIPYAFAQGPGQAATYGKIYEQFGWENASMVGITFSAIGFLTAFLVGIPIVKMGIKRGIAKNVGTFNENMTKGYYPLDEQKESMGEVTIHSGNVETLTFHFAIMCICYILALVISKIVSYLPGFLGTSMGGMFFMWGLIAAYIIKFFMKKFKIEHIHNDVLQSKFTGFMSDYLIVCSFMSVKISVVGKWIIPIIIESVVVTILTAFVCIYFGQRIGGSNDFERTLGLYGTSTGTVPSGIALVRIVDPSLKTTTAIELGMMNFPMMFSSISSIAMMACASGAFSIQGACVILMISAFIYMVALKAFKCWGNKSYSFKSGNEYIIEVDTEAINYR